jgi:hypothetical protein
MPTNLHPLASSVVSRRTRYCPRYQIMVEIVAGWLWLSLHLPSDLQRQEVEDIAKRLIFRIQGGADPLAVTADLARIQNVQFQETVMLAPLRALAARLADFVRSS